MPACAGTANKSAFTQPLVSGCRIALTWPTNRTGSDHAISFHGNDRFRPQGHGATLNLMLAFGFVAFKGGKVRYSCPSASEFSVLAQLLSKSG